MNVSLCGTARIQGLTLSCLYNQCRENLTVLMCATMGQEVASIGPTVALCGCERKLYGALEVAALPWAEAEFSLDKLNGLRRLQSGSPGLQLGSDRAKEALQQAAVASGWAPRLASPRPVAVRPGTRKPRGSRHATAEGSDGSRQD